MDYTLDHKSPVPLHLQLEEILRTEIANEVWPQNSMIPSENVLSKEYGLSRMTVRSVIVKLTQEGLLYRVPGKGTFVKEKKIIGKPLSQMGIREQLEKMGYANTTRLVKAEKGTASSELAEKLRIHEGEGIWEIYRLRYVEGVPFSLHESHVPCKVSPDILDHGFDFERQQLCDILKQQYHLTQERVIETLEMVRADQDRAKLLEVKTGYPLIHIEDTIFGSEDKPNEYTSVYFIGDRIRLEIVNTFDEGAR